VNAAAGPGRPPVILIGMHRSGTTLLAKLLDALGLFVGWRLAENHEASFFNRHNSWLLAAAGGRWDTPAPIDHLLADPVGRELASEYLRGRLSSLPALEFLGPARFLRRRSLLALAEPWGWKDPRTTVTLPIWLELFPGARVVHLVRNGVDVAASLVRRQRSGLDVARRTFARRRRLFRLVAKRGWFGTSPRMLDRSQAIALWEEYLTYAERFTAGLGERLLVMRYEDFLADPAGKLGVLACFCGLAATGDALAAATVSVRPQRSLAFRDDAELTVLWRETRNRPWMRRFGYDLGSEPSGAVIR
jgi:Sulfotransferase family